MLLEVASGAWFRVCVIGRKVRTRGKSYPQLGKGHNLAPQSYFSDSQSLRGLRQNSYRVMQFLSAGKNFTWGDKSRRFGLLGFGFSSRNLLGGSVKI